MDIVQDWAGYLLDPNNPFRPWISQILSFANTVRSYTLPVIYQATKNPDLATIALLLVILFVSLKLLNMLFQTLMFWFRLARQIAFWGGLAVVALWMWSRGPDGMMEDVGYWTEVWGNEYQYWREREGAARMARGNQQPYGQPAAGRTQGRRGW